MTIFDVVILSLVEGITEFLPISSTAHLILTSHLLGIPKTTYLTTFEVAIQLGAIGAVVVLYFKKILSQKRIFYKACVGFIPTGILGLLFFDYIKIFLNDPFVPVITLFLGGVAIIGIEKYFNKQNTGTARKTLKELTYKDALSIGLIQSISMVPGVSRAASSIFGGMILRLDRTSAVEFSFLLAIPTMIVATGFDLLKTAPAFTSNELLLLAIGIAGSFITALGVIKWLIKYVQTNNFILFGVYRIVLSVLYYFLFLR